MSFKFSFLPEDEEEHKSSETLNSQQNAAGTVLKDGLGREDKAEEIQLGKCNSDHVSFAQIKLSDGLLIKYIQQSDIHEITDAVGGHTDLVPGVYEGGRKTWECSYILLDYLSETYSGKSISEKNVLELGCGSGIPGLFCLLRGANVTFQDYNKDVVEEITMPNVHLTCGSNSSSLGKCRFFSGDWKHLCALLSQQQLKYDIILASETLYSINSYEKLHNIFSRCTTDDGVVYVASKYHYFGVGGGVESFKTYVSSCGVFNLETVFSTDENLQCVIMKLTRDGRKNLSKQNTKERDES